MEGGYYFALFLYEIACNCKDCAFQYRKGCFNCCFVRRIVQCNNCSCYTNNTCCNRSHNIVNFLTHLEPPIYTVGANTAVISTCVGDAGIVSNATAFVPSSPSTSTPSICHLLNSHPSAADAVKICFEPAANV